MNKLVYKKGFLANVGGIIAGGILIFLGLFLVSFFSIVSVFGILLLLIGSVMFITSGVEIDLKNKTVKPYINYFGIKFPHMGNSPNYKSISVIQQILGYRHSRNDDFYDNGMTSQEIMDAKRNYNLILLNENHHKKLILKTFRRYDEAVKEAKSLSEKMEMEFVKYNPVRSRPPGGKRKRVGL